MKFGMILILIPKAYPFFRRKKSLLARLKLNLFGKKKNASEEVQTLKTSSEEEDVDTSFSRASSGIGTMSTKSKISPEFDDDADSQQSNKDVSDCSLDDSQSSKIISKENIIPVIPRHNFGVFSHRFKSDTGADRRSGKGEQGGNNLDKISLAENDDKDFEYFATKEEPDILAIDETKPLTDIGEGDEDENKPSYDHTPHDMFVQLSEINEEHTFWEEKSRWIKYEECKEEGKFSYTYTY